MNDSDTAHAVGRTIRVARVIPAPPDTLFALWTDPAAARQWWGKTDSATLMACEVELKPGGNLLYAVKRSEKEGHEVASGTFREIVAPHHLVMSWSCEERHVKDSTVTVEFVSLNDGSSRVSIVHERLPSPAEAAIHQAGWSDVLQDLAAWVSAPPED